MWDYTQKVMDLFHDPRNMGEILSDICQENETVVMGEIGSIACGDALRLHLKIDKKNHQILDARFQTFGCASAIASSSALTELIKGMTVEEATRITNRDIADYLGGLPEEKMHCSVMGQEALEAAVASYKGIPLQQHEEDHSPLVCKCFGVTRTRIKRVISDNNLTTAEQVTNYIKAGGGCGSCLTDIDDLITQVTASQNFRNISQTPTVIPSVPSTTKSLTIVQKIALIEQVLEEEIRPFLALDGGDVELYGLEGDKVKVLLKGACDSCPSVIITLKMAIEQRLRDRVLPNLVVEAVF